VGSVIGENNLSIIFQNSLLSVGPRNSITFLSKGDPLRAVSLSGIELHENAIATAHYILSVTNHFKNKSRPILLGMSPGLNFVVTFIASIYAGVTIVPIPISSNKLQQERIINILNDCNAKEILCDEVGFEMLKNINNTTQHEIHVISDALKNIKINKDELPGFQHIQDDPAYIQYTSGSFREPKGILISHANIINNSKLVGNSWRMDKNTITGSWLPHYHDMGLGAIIISLMLKSQVVFMSPLSFIQKPVRWFNMIDAFKVTLSGAPPFAYNLCCQKINPDEYKNLNLSSWDMAYLGSEVVHKQTIEVFKEKFATLELNQDAFFACYGMAESNLYIAGEKQKKRISDKSNLIEPCYLSKQIAKSLLIVDFETKKKSPDGKQGEIWVQSSSVAKGYIRPSREGILINSKGFKERYPGLKGKWFKTGDIGYIMERKLYVIGRQKDTIKINGLNIAASDIEWYASQVHSNLNPQGAAAFNTDDPLNTMACLLIETFSRGNMDNLEIKKEIRAKIFSYFSLELKEILILKSGSLDRTSSGKIRRYRIKKNYEAGLYKSDTQFI
jgi:acyl-CoA synthetase (AMP-forming)/AMP-acid ligase II